MSSAEGVAERVLRLVQTRARSGQQANVELAKRIRQVHQDSRQTYGSPRVHTELREAGVLCGRNRVARLMRQQGLRAKQALRTKVTTDSRHAYPIAPNVLNRALEAADPNRTWLADITYIDTVEGWLYLAVTLDVFPRMIVGWAIADHLETSLVIEALDMALFQRHPRDGRCIIPIEAASTPAPIINSGSRTGGSK